MLYFTINFTDWYSSKLWLELGVHEWDFLGITCGDLPIPTTSLEVALSYYQQIDNTIGDDEGGDDLLVLPLHNGGIEEGVVERLTVRIDLPKKFLGGIFPGRYRCCRIFAC